MARAAFEAAATYAEERETFGRKIAEHQGVGFKLAEMATQIEAARQLILSAAGMKDRGENYTTQASMAKLFASEMVNRTTAKALQMHGGYGFTKEYPVERFYRDAKIMELYEGSRQTQKNTIASAIIGKLK